MISKTLEEDKDLPGDRESGEAFEDGFMLDIDRKWPRAVFLRAGLAGRCCDQAARWVKDSILTTGGPEWPKRRDNPLQCCLTEENGHRRRRYGVTGKGLSR